MNKTALAIQMLELLYSRGKMSRKELAEILETTERKILDLKQELEVAGYRIDSTTGKHGGYFLQTNYFLPVFPLTDLQKNVLAVANDYLANANDFLYPSEFQKIIDKLKVVSNIKHQNTIIYQMKNNIGEQLQKTIMELEQAILEQKQVKITYLGIKARELQDYTVEPYWIINWENAYYLIGYEVNKKAFRMFKLVKNRWKKMEILAKKFYKLDYQLKDIMGEVALIKDEIIKVEFLVFGYQARLMEEKEIGLYSEKKWIDDETLSIACEVEGMYEIQKLILSFGANAKVIQPVSLCQKIVEEIESMYNQYKK